MNHGPSSGVVFVVKWAILGVLAAAPVGVYAEPAANLPTITASPAPVAPVVPAAPPGAGAATQPAAEKVDDTPLDIPITWSTLTRNASIQLNTGAVNYNINLQGEMVLPPGKSRVVAISNQAIVTSALDQDGQSMLQARPDIVAAFGQAVSSRDNNIQFQALQFNGSRTQAPIYVNLQQITSKPTRIKELKGIGCVLIATKTQVKVIEAEVNAEWQPLVEGCEVKVTALNLQQNFGNLTLSIRKPGDQQRNWQAMWDAPVVMRLELVDEGANATAPQFINTNFGGNTDSAHMLINVQANFNGSGSGLKNARTIRITMATKTKTQEVPFTVKDVPLP